MNCKNKLASFISQFALFSWHFGVRFQVSGVRRVEPVRECETSINKSCLKDSYLFMDVSDILINMADCIMTQELS